LVVVSLDRQEACARALERYIKTRRYVPLSLIFDVYGNEPILTYYRIRDDTEWASVLKLSSKNLRENGPELIYENGGSPAKAICK